MNPNTLLRAVDEIAKYKEGKAVLKVTEVTCPIVDVKQLRSDLGLSQTEFANRYNLSVATIRNWEQGIREPDGPARLLLNLIAQNPKLIEKEVKLLRIA